MSRVYIRSGKLTLGSWELPGEAIDNWDAQKELGWQLFYELRANPSSIIRVVLAINADEAEKK